MSHPSMWRLRMQALGDLFAHYKAVWSAAWGQREQWERRHWTREEAEFLPPALALQETPPSPAPRVAIGLLIVFACIAVLWACFGRVDIVSVAQGKVVPSEHVKSIQPLQTAAIRHIAVREGQAVKAGDLLIAFDDTSAEADQDRLRQELLSQQLQVLRQQTLVDAVKSLQRNGVATEPRLLAGDNFDATRLAEAQRQLQAQHTEIVTRWLRIRSDIARREAERQATQAQLTKIETTLPLVQQRAKDYRRLVDAAYVSQHGFLEQERARLDLEGDLSVQRSRLVEIDASLRETRQQADSLFAETLRAAHDDIGVAQRQIAALEQELVKATVSVKALALHAPVDGVVQQLAVHTVGGIVTPAQVLMLVVPKDDVLEVEAVLPNREIGFVHEGQEAHVKVDTFEFTRYGTLPATVSRISRDAIAHEQLGLVYAVRVRLHSQQLPESDAAALGPGMAVAVEIKTGQRRVIDYFLSPLMRHTSESLRER
jgi:hemolysin D